MRQYRTIVWLSALGMVLGVGSALSFLIASAASADIEGGCVAFCDDGGSSGSSGGGGWSGGDWSVPSGLTPELTPEQLAQQAATAANQRGVAYYESQDWDNAVVSFEEALRHDPNDPVIQQNLQNAKEMRVRYHQEHQQEVERHLREQKLKDASARINQMLDDFSVQMTSPSTPMASSGLDFQSVGMDFDGKRKAASPGGGLGFMPAGSATTPAAASANPPEPFIDSSVVDLHDATTYVVDPSKVSGSPPPPSLGPSEVPDSDVASTTAPPPTATTAPVPTKDEMDQTIFDFLVARPFDREVFNQSPPEKLQEYIEWLNSPEGEGTRKRLRDRVLQGELAVADREGRTSPLVELEVLSQDPTLANEVEAVRERVRQQEIEASREAYVRQYDRFEKETNRLFEQAAKERGRMITPQELDEDPKFGPLWTAASDRAWQQFDVEVGKAHEDAERELSNAVKRLKPRMTTDFDAEIRQLRESYLRYHEYQEGDDITTPK